MRRWKAVIPAIRIARVVSVMPPPQVWRGQIHRAPPPPAPFPPLLVVVMSLTLPPPQKQWDAVVLFPSLRSSSSDGAPLRPYLGGGGSRKGNTPTRVQRYLPFAPIVSLWMQSNNRDGADLPTLLQNEGGDVTFNQNWHMATSTQRARQFSATSSAPPLSTCTGGVVVAVAVAVVVVVRRVSKAVGSGNGGGRLIQIRQRQQRVCWGGIAITVIIIRDDNAPIVDIIVVNPWTRVPIETPP